VVRVNVVVEGQTEEAFINNVLAGMLWPLNIYLTARLLGVPGHKGGRPNFARLKKDVLNLLKQDRTAHCSMMLDLYGLGEGFPGTPFRRDLTGAEKADQIEEAVKREICALVPDVRPDIRFVPYIQVHEYEGLLFSNPEAFAESMHQPILAGRFRHVRDSFPTPEDINDDPTTAPSKRVLHLHPRYKKVIDGTTAAMAIGVENMRRECPHFRQWVEQLEALTAPPTESAAEDPCEER
jgi:hypothetical protein